MARPKSPEVGIRIHVRVTKKQYDKLRRVAGQGGYSVSETLRRAIDNYLAFLDSKHL